MFENFEPCQIIYADPPWQFRDRCNAGARGVAHKYPTMDWRAIARLPVHELAAPNCLLAMWWVAAMPEEALRVVDAWGFSLKTMTGFTWCKVSAEGRTKFGMGNWTRANAENCLFAARGRPKRVDAGVSQLIRSPAGRHSEKPLEARLRLVQLIGDVPRIELFGRGHIPDGWQAYGNEIAPVDGDVA